MVRQSDWIRIWRFSSPQQKLPLKISRHQPPPMSTLYSVFSHFFDAHTIKAQ